MEIDIEEPMKPGDAEVGRAVSRLLDAAARLAPASAWALVDEVCQVLSASAGRLYAVDYSLRRLQRVDRSGPSASPSRSPAPLPAAPS